MSPTALTDKQAKALAVLAEETRREPRGITPGRFGDLMYPDTAGHVNSAHGLAANAARSQAAGSVLARLRKRGWVAVDHLHGYGLHRITAAGLAMLAPEPTRSHERGK